MNRRQSIKSLLLLAALAQGCLYWQGINHAPQGRIAVDSEVQRSLGDSITLSAEVIDPDGDRLSIAWRVSIQPDEKGSSEWTLVSAQGASSAEELSNAVLELAAGEVAPVLSREPELALKRLPLRGTYVVAADVVDEHGASSTLSRTFVVGNRPPTIRALLLEGDPTHAGHQHVPDLVDGQRVYPLHAAYQLRVVAEDPDGDGTCASGATASYRVSDLAFVKVVDQRMVACDPQLGPERLLIRFAAAAGLDGSMVPSFAVAATIKDGHGGVATQNARFVLAPNRPPCLDQTVPRFQDSRALWARYDEVLTFEVPSANDDVDGDGVSIEWQEALGTDPQGLRTRKVELGGTSSYRVAAYSYRPGDVMLIRVKATEAGTRAASCADEQALCESTQINGAPCYSWVTWIVEYR